MNIDEAAKATRRTLEHIAGRLVNLARWLLTLCVIVIVFPLTGFPLMNGISPTLGSIYVAIWCLSFIVYLVVEMSNEPWR